MVKGKVFKGESRLVKRVEMKLIYLDFNFLKGDKLIANYRSYPWQHKVSESKLVQKEIHSSLFR